MAEPVMVCLAGEQTMANAIAARQLRAGRLVILHTDDLERSLRPADRLAGWWLSQQRGPTELREVGDGFHYSDLARVLGALVAELAGQEVLVNVTGGTKPMSLASMAFAARQGWRAVYLDTEHGQLINLSGSAGAERLTARFSVAEVLALNGHEVCSMVPLERPLVAAAQAVAAHRDWQQELSQAIQTGAVDHLTVRLSRPLPQPVWAEWRRSGVLDATDTASGTTCTLTDDGWEAVHANGWLELLTGEALRLAGATEVTISAEVARVHDEVDVFAMFERRLVVAECKAGKSINGDQLGSLARDAQRYGGSMAVPLMVWDPPQLPLDNGRERARAAREQGVHLLLGHDPVLLARSVRDLLGLGGRR